MYIYIGNIMAFSPLCGFNYVLMLCPKLQIRASLSAYANGNTYQSLPLLPYPLATEEVKYFTLHYTGTYMYMYMYITCMYLYVIEYLRVPLSAYANATKDKILP